MKNSLIIAFIILLAVPSFSQGLNLSKFVQDTVESIEKMMDQMDPVKQVIKEWDPYFHSMPWRMFEKIYIADKDFYDSLMENAKYPGYEYYFDKTWDHNEAPINTLFSSFSTEGRMGLMTMMYKWLLYNYHENNASHVDIDDEFDVYLEHLADKDRGMVRYILEQSLLRLYPELTEKEQMSYTNFKHLYRLNRAHRLSIGDPYQAARVASVGNLWSGSSSLEFVTGPRLDKKIPGIEYK